MKALIVEDEPLNASHLNRLLKKIDSSLEVLAVCQSVAQTLNWLQQNPRPDLMFLDVHVADGFIFDLFKSYTEDVPVIFTTAFDHYALQAFKVNSIDYLLKPIEKESLQTALQKYHKLHKQNTSILPFHPILQELAEQFRKPYKTRFMVRLGDHVAAIKAQEIHFFHYEDGLVFLHRTDGKKFPVDFSLDTLCEILEPDSFFRINRKTIVNMEHLGRMTTYFNSRLIVEFNQIPEADCVVSRERTAEFKKWLDQ
jgi:DNA-binding LytR/AlgR family response regulator